MHHASSPIETAKVEPPPAETPGTPDTPAALAACFAGGVALVGAGLAGFAWCIGDDMIAMILIALSLGLLALVAAVNP